MNIQKLSMQYANSNLLLENLFRVSLPPGKSTFDQTTSEGVCGFVFPIKGKAKFTVCENEYLLESGTVLHAGSKMALDKQVVGDDNWEFILMHYRVLNESNSSQSLFNMHYALKIFHDQSSELLTLLERLIQLEEESSEGGSQLAAKTVLYEIITKLMDFACERSRFQTKDPLEDVANYIHENLEHNLSVAEIAQEYGMNCRQFSYLFHKKFGLSPKKYMIDTQIGRAKELIIHEDMPITEISNLVGYEDSLHFSKIFKQNTGMSPIHFRNKFGEKSILI